MSQAIEPRQRIHQLVDRLPATALDAALRLLENLPQRTAPAAREIELLSIIQRRLPPVQQERWASLREKCEQETLSDREQQELLTYSDLLELWNVERLEAIAELAQLRQVEFKALYQELTVGDRNTISEDARQA